MDESLYMSASLDEFHAARTHGEEVFAAPQDDAQIQEAVTRLHTAWLNMRLKADEKLIEELNSLAAELETYDLNLLSEVQAGQVTQLKTRMKTVASAPEVEKIEVGSIIKEAKDLIETLPDDAKVSTPGDDKPADSDNKQTKPAKENKTSAKDTGKNSAAPAVNKSVRTAAAMNQTFFGSLLAAAAGTLLFIRRKNRK